MEWDLEESHRLAILENAPSMPLDIASAAQSDFWRWAFTVWRYASKGPTWNLFHLYLALHDRLAWDDVFANYLASGAPLEAQHYALPEVVSGYLDGSLDEEACRAALLQVLETQYFADEWTAFVGDVRTLQQEAKAMRREQIEREAEPVTLMELRRRQQEIDDYIEAAIDGLEMDDRLHFEQVGDLLFSSDNLPDWRFRNGLQQLPGYADGRLRRKTSMGRMTIEVTGRYDEAAFKVGFRRFSDKRLQFS